MKSILISGKKHVKLFIGNCQNQALSLNNPEKLEVLELSDAKACALICFTNYKETFIEVNNNYIKKIISKL